jgi:hypothetical protein
MSSVGDAINLVKEQFEGTSSRKTTNRKKPGTNWNNEEIATMLDIANESMEQVEGNFMFKHAGSDRLFPFDYHTLQNIPVRKYSYVTQSLFILKEQML